MQRLHAALRLVTTRMGIEQKNRPERQSGIKFHPSVHARHNLTLSLWIHTMETRTPQDMTDMAKLTMAITVLTPKAKNCHSSPVVQILWLVPETFLFVTPPRAINGEWGLHEHNQNRSCFSGSQNSLSSKCYAMSEVKSWVGRNEALANGDCDGYLVSCRPETCFCRTCACISATFVSGTANAISAPNYSPKRSL